MGGNDTTSNDRDEGDAEDSAPSADIGIDIDDLSLDDLDGGSSDSADPTSAADPSDSTQTTDTDESATADPAMSDTSQENGTPQEDDTPQGGLFDDLLSGDPIFENKDVLRPSYTPDQLPHRQDQINDMATILVGALRGETPSNILIYGKTGTGKTASAKFVSNELETTSQKYDVPCEVEYINCEVTDTQYRVLAQLANTFIEANERHIESRLASLRALKERADTGQTSLDDIEPDTNEDAEIDPDATSSDVVPSVGDRSDTASSTNSTDTTIDTDEADFDSIAAVEERIAELEADLDAFEPVPMTGWPTDRVYSTFFDAVDYHERVVVIMLDEIDKLVEKSGDDTLYNLSRMNSELDNSRVSIMGISNDLKFTEFLDPRVKSSLGEEEIVFPPYDATQLRDILAARADIAFEPDSLSEDVIPLCAAFAAQEHGDARRALDLLRTAGELAERGQTERVGEDHVRQAQEKIEIDRVVEVVRTLPTQSKVVLFAVILLERNGAQNINTGEVYNIYRRLCDEIDADVLTQRRVTDLISELDMLGIVNAVVVSKGRYGRTKEMNLSVPIDETEAVLTSDSRLGDIEDVQPFVQARFDS
ncbi:Cdc6/Cdc18 family protein [Halococcus saccharolyticus]|uniref:ORC1-type DNA replication protein n=1 Tax=Halococcus saccharolyticus DSM 5350 TaxID=1227455 RepID=M0MAB6_9EURY|nr:ORC1-type DNA replication protein [Halococcus saccharolyticus]EMA42691.1 cell division control protein cdc6-like protein [Halococcus saccharolyticus DSM 5350]